MARLSSRNASRRDQPSSPPHQTRHKAPPIPTSRTARSTRSQSANAVDSIPAAASRRGLRGGARQASIESVESNTSIGSGRATRSQKASTAKDSRGLPTLPEIQEDEVKEEEEEEEAEFGEVEEVEIEIDEEEIEEEERGSENDADATLTNARLEYPDDISQMSGTTAITAGTSHSAAEVASLDSDIIVESLPSLYDNANELVRLLAPDELSDEVIENKMKELRIIGSKLARQLKRAEDRFQIDRVEFGSDDYIRTEFVLRKLLGSENPEEGNFRPDAILYAANLATILKTFMVIQRESQKTLNLLMELDMCFPGRFTREFGTSALYGDSQLVDSAFELALDIRTQFTIVVLESQKDRDDFAPDQILAANFYEPRPAGASFSSLDNVTKHWRPKSILGSDLSQRQSKRIQKRVQTIFNTFRDSPAAIEARDIVSFETLEEAFPWVVFVMGLITWGRSRMDEIHESIGEQGGVENIIQELVAVMQTRPAPPNGSWNQSPRAKKPQTVPEEAESSAEAIIPASPGKSLYKGKATLRFMEKLKRRGTTSYPTSSNLAKSSDQLRPRGSSMLAPFQAQQTASTSGQSSRQEPAKETRQFTPGLEPSPELDELDVTVRKTSTRPTVQYADVIEAHKAEKNKENQPGPSEMPKRRLLDRQPDAERVEWDSQDDESEPPIIRRPQPARSESEPSEDEGFQEDKRSLVPKLSRKRVRVPSAEEDDLDDHDAPSHPKRARVRAEQPPRASHGSRRRADSPVSVRENMDEDVEEDVPLPSFQHVKVVARRNAAQDRSHKQQLRTPWSEADTNYLIEAIEEFGCSWAKINRLPNWEVPRDQVAMKDRARNIKVNFLLSDMDLPGRFDEVRLGKKEIARVRVRHPEFEQ